MRQRPSRSSAWCERHWIWLLRLGGLAQTSAQEKTPGDQMQDKGSVKGSPGASGYAPGHMTKKKGSVKGTTGASGYAPGNTKTGADVKAGSKIDSK
jgi:hypothetical protein